MRTGSVVLCAALLIGAGHVDAGSNVYRCSISTSYRADVKGDFKKDKGVKVEIIFDANTGHLVEKRRIGNKTVHRRYVFRVIGKGEPLAKGGRKDVTAFRVLNGAAASVVWTLSILFMTKKLLLLYVQRHFVSHGTCREM